MKNLEIYLPYLPLYVFVGGAVLTLAILLVKSFIDSAKKA